MPDRVDPRHVEIRLCLDVDRRHERNERHLHPVLRAALPIEVVDQLGGRVAECLDAAVAPHRAGIVECERDLVLAAARHHLGLEVERHLADADYGQERRIHVAAGDDAVAALQGDGVEPREVQHAVTRYHRLDVGVDEGVGRGVFQFALARQRDRAGIHGIEDFGLVALMAGHIDRAAEQSDQRHRARREENCYVSALIPVKAIPCPGEHFPHDGLRYVLFFGGLRRTALTPRLHILRTVNPG